MSEIKEQMKQLREEMNERLQEFIVRQQAAQYFVEVYMSDVFASQFETDEEIDQAVHDYILQMFGEYLVFTPDVAELFEQYAQAGLMMYDDYEGNYIQLATVKADALMQTLEQLPTVALDERSSQVVATFERFASQQTVIDVEDLTDEALAHKNAYLYLALLYLQATTESTLQQMIYLQQYLQHVEVVYLTPAAQAKLLEQLQMKGYLSGEENELHLTAKTAELFQKLEMAVENEKPLGFEQQLEQF